MKVIVASFTRRIVASLTALSVLMCSALCACPSMASAETEKSSRHSHESTTDHSSSNDVPPCHGHGKAPAADEQIPAEPCGNHDGQSCSHCEAPAMAQVAAPSIDVAAHYEVLAFFSPLVEEITAPQVAHRIYPTPSGVPPPAEWSTLLRLHCALIL